jgi:peptidylprolyl isomerase
MFEVAARSAVVCGQFDMAKQLYEAVPDEDQKEIDLRLEYSLEDLRKEYEAEEKLRAAEFESDQLPRVKFKTTQGDFVAELFIDQAPTAVSRFIQLVEEGFYDGKDFFQVIEHLLALAGDPDFTPGDPSVKFLVDEHTRPDARSGLRGALVMAKVPREDESDERFYPNSASSQFAILLTPIVDAQRDQTIFGSVIEGMETVCRLNRVDPHEKKKKGEEEVPADSIIEATMIRRPDTLPAPEFYQ